MIGRAWPMVVLAEEVVDGGQEEVQQEGAPTEDPPAAVTTEEPSTEETGEENNEVSPTPTPETAIDNDAEVINDINTKIQGYQSLEFNPDKEI